MDTSGCLAGCQSSFYKLKVAVTRAPVVRTRTSGSGEPGLSEARSAAVGSSEARSAATGFESEEVGISTAENKDSADAERNDGEGWSRDGGGGA